MSMHVHVGLFLVAAVSVVACGGASASPSVAPSSPGSSAASAPMQTPEPSATIVATPEPTPAPSETTDLVPNGDTLVAIAPTGLAGATITDAVGTPQGYVAVGRVETPPFGNDVNGAVWTSADGVRWQLHQPASVVGATLTGVARGSTGRLVAAGRAGTGAGSPAIWTSDDDGSTWTRVAGLPTDGSRGWLSDVVAYQGGFVAVGDMPAPDFRPHAAALVSRDGVRWTRSTFVEGAISRYFTGVIATDAGLVGYGARGDGEGLEANAAVVWHSSDGDRWQLSSPTPEFINPDTGGGSTRRMELVFAAGNLLIGMASPSDFGVPHVFQGENGTAWSPLDVADALRYFVPTSALTARDGSELIGGSGFLDDVVSTGTAALMWQYTPRGDWLRLTVEQAGVDPAAVALDLNITALIQGPAGPLALGNRVHRTAPYTQDGVVWRVVEP